MYAIKKTSIGSAIVLIVSMLIGCGPSSEDQTPTTVALIIATATATGTSTPIPTSTPTPTSTPVLTQAYNPSPRWMMLNQPGYNAQILGEEWKYLKDGWDDKHACANYQNNNYERWFQQCFAYSSSISYDEILAPALKQGFETLEPQNKFTNVNRIDLVAQRSTDHPNQVRILQQIETERYVMLIEMVVNSPGDLPLQTVYETLAANVIDFVLQDMLVNSHAVPVPTPTPLSRQQSDLVSRLGGMLITETDLEDGWEAMGDNISTTSAGICRSFELRVNEDVKWVNLINCIYFKPPNFNINSFVASTDVLLESSYDHEDDFIMYGKDFAGRFYYSAVLFKDGLVYQAALISRVFAGDTVEGVFNQNIDDLLNQVLTINRGQPSNTNPPIFRDDFDKTISPEWIWNGADDNQWNLTNKPGFLHINLVHTANAFEEGPVTFLLRDVEEENFEIVTRILFEPKRNFQGVGLVIYENDRNLVGLMRSYADVANYPGNAIYFDNMSPLAPSYDDPDYANYPTPLSNPSEVYLKLRREGNTYTGFYSLDGKFWTLVGVHTSPIKPVSYGLSIGRSDQPISADFDYFELYTLP